MISRDTCIIGPQRAQLILWKSRSPTPSTRPAEIPQPRPTTRSEVAFHGARGRSVDGFGATGSRPSQSSSPRPRPRGQPPWLSGSESRDCSGNLASISAVELRSTGQPREALPRGSWVELSRS